MYTGAASLGACGGHAYGVVLRGKGTGPLCDGPLATADRAASVTATAGIFVATDDTPGCAGVAAAKAQTQVPAHMAVWVR